MNCRSEILEVTVETRQVEEATLAVLHTILLHRSTGKFHYKKEGTYSIGTVGTLDIDCDFIDFTFVRVSSEELDRVLRKAVSEFKVLAGFCVAPVSAARRRKRPILFVSYRMLWTTRATMAWGRFRWSFTRRRSLGGSFPTSASPGRFGTWRWTSSAWQMSKKDRSAGKRLGRSWARRSSMLSRSSIATSTCQRCPPSLKWTMCLTPALKMCSHICTKSHFRSLKLWAPLLAQPWGGWLKTLWLSEKASGHFSRCHGYRPACSPRLRFTVAQQKVPNL